MARGMVNGEAIVSQAQTEAWDKGCERAGIGEPTKERGVWVWDEEKQKLVRPWERKTQETKEARFAPIMAGRFYENVCATDGADIGSRRRRKDYMRAHNLADADDFKGVWANAKKQRDDVFKTGGDHKERRDQVARAWYHARTRRK